MLVSPLFTVWVRVQTPWEQSVLTAASTGGAEDSIEEAEDGVCDADVASGTDSMEHPAINTSRATQGPAVKLKNFSTNSLVERYLNAGFCKYKLGLEMMKIYMKS